MLGDGDSGKVEVDPTNGGGFTPVAPPKKEDVYVTNNSNFDDLAKMYDDKNLSVSDFEIKIGGRIYKPDQTKTDPNGGAPIYTGLSDQQVYDYFAYLAGGEQNIRTSPTNPDISFAKLSDGTSLTLRKITSSTGKWTIDIANNPKFKKKGRKEIKFD